MEKEIVNQVQEVQRVPYRINPRRNTPRHKLIKLTKTKHKERILKAAREKQEVTYKGLQIILQSYSHQDSVVLAPKQKHSPMEQDRKPRNKPKPLWVYFWAFYLVPLVYVSVLVPVPHCLDDCSFVV